MGRYPTIRDTNEFLDTSNPTYGPLLQAITKLREKEDEFYENRRKVFDEYDFGDFGESAEQVEAKYDADIGDKPWEYKSKFDNAGATRRGSSGGATRFVQNSFTLSGITDGFVSLLVENGVDDDGDPCGGEAYVLPENRKAEFCESDPAFRVLDFPIGRGKASVDCLYQNLAAFNSSSDQASTGYFVQGENDDDGAPQFIRQFVYTTFGEVPFNWNETDDYTKRQLSSLKAAGDKYEEIVRSGITEYESVLVTYREFNGGDLGYEEHLSTDTDFPWEGLVGDNTTYNRPEDLPGRLVRQARGVLKPEDEI